MHRPHLHYLLVALVAGACARGAAPTPTADPSSARRPPAGPVIGFAGEAGEHAWLGIPFAQPPTGERRWRVLEFPRDADGRSAERDDQAIGIYVSYGGILGQRSIAYRWETTTPVGSEGDATYGAGLVKVHWIAVRNAEDGAGEFRIEERNVAADFQRVFGFVPTNPIIAVTTNSQYTGTRAVAELDWIELMPQAEIRSRD